MTRVSKTWILLPTNPQTYLLEQFDCDLVDPRRRGALYSNGPFFGLLLGGGPMAVEITVLASQYECIPARILDP